VDVTRQRVRAFAAAVEIPARAGTTMLATVDSLRAVAAPVIAEEFRRILRARLVDGADRSIQSSTVDRRSARHRLVLIGAALVLISGYGIARASATALPGDALYSVKRAGESTELAVAGSSSARADLLLAAARMRLSEASRLARLGRSVAPALRDMDGATRDAVRTLGSDALTQHESRPLDSLDAFVVAQHRDVVALSSSVSGEDRRAFDESTVLLQRVAARSTAVRQAVGCRPSGDSAAIDDLGPVPSGCAPRTHAGAGAVPGLDGFMPQSPIPGSAVPGSPMSDSRAPSARVPSATAPDLPIPRRSGPGLPAPDSPHPDLPLPSLAVPSLPSPHL
jgi:hypothetical protein